MTSYKFQSDIIGMSFCQGTKHSNFLVAMVIDHGYRSMADSVCYALPFFSVTLQTEILSTETADFLKRIIFLKSFDSI